MSLGIGDSLPPSGFAIWEKKANFVSGIASGHWWAAAAARGSEGAPSAASLCLSESGFSSFSCVITAPLCWGEWSYPVPNSTPSVSSVNPDHCLVKESSNDPISFPWFNEHSDSAAAQELLEHNSAPIPAQVWDNSNSEMIPVVTRWVGKRWQSW